MFCMSEPSPGNAMPIPQPLPGFPFRKPTPDPAARVRRRVGRWLRHLSDIGATLTTSLRGLARSQFASERVEPAALDLGLGRDLLLRAMRWIAALQARFTAEARAATRIAIDPPERPSGPLDQDVDALARMLRAIEGPKPVQYRGVRRDDCTDGKPTAEVVTQICADLAVVATMLDDDEAKRQIAAIAAAARAMLGEPEAALLPMPDLPGRAPGAPAAAPTPAVMSGVVSCAPSFDTG